MRENLRDLVSFKCPRENMDAVDALLHGATKEELEDILGGDSPEEREIRRMNFVGGLRSFGFVIEGGRRGGQLYKLIGFEEKGPEETIADWHPEDLAALDFVRSVPVQDQDWQYLEGKLELGIKKGVIPPDAHEASFLQLFSYDLGASHTRGFWHSWKGIVVQRFSTRPRFRIRPFTMSLQAVVNLARGLGKLSYAPVRVDGITETFARQLRAAAGGGVSKYREAIYDVKKIANVDPGLFNSRSRSSLRKFDRECVFVEVAGGTEAVEHVIAEWRRIVEPKQRQLSITRDYTAARISVPKMILLGLRDDMPVCSHILGFIPGVPMATQIVEKSLNYSSQIGGKAGTADWNLVKTCQFLRERGFSEFNVGHISGGTDGLARHKLRLMARETFTWSWVSPWSRQ